MLPFRLDFGRHIKRQPRAGRGGDRAEPRGGADPKPETDEAHQHGLQQDHHMVYDKQNGLWKAGNIIPQKKREYPIIRIADHLRGANKKMKVHPNTENDQEKNVGDRFISE